MDFDYKLIQLENQVNALERDVEALTTANSSNDSPYQGIRDILPGSGVDVTRSGHNIVVNADLPNICFHGTVATGYYNNAYLPFGSVGHGPYLKNVAISHTRAGDTITLDASGKYLVVFRVLCLFAVTGTFTSTTSRRISFAIHTGTSTELAWDKLFLDVNYYVPAATQDADSGNDTEENPVLTHPATSDYRNGTISRIIDTAQLTSGNIKIYQAHVSGTAPLTVEEVGTSISIFGPLRDKTVEI